MWRNPRNVPHARRTGGAADRPPTASKFRGVDEPMISCIAGTWDRSRRHRHLADRAAGNPRRAHRDRSGGRRRNRTSSARGAAKVRPRRWPPDPLRSDTGGSEWRYLRDQSPLMQPGRSIDGRTGPTSAIDRNGCQSIVYSHRDGRSSGGSISGRNWIGITTDCGAHPPRGTPWYRRAVGCVTLTKRIAG